MQKYWYTRDSKGSLNWATYEWTDKPGLINGRYSCWPIGGAMKRNIEVPFALSPGECRGPFYKIDRNLVPCDQHDKESIMSEQFWLAREASGAFSECVAVYDREVFQQYEGSYPWLESAGYLQCLMGKQAENLHSLVPPGKCVGPFRMEGDKFVLCDPPVNEEKERLFANAPAEPTIGFPSMPEPPEPSITPRLSILRVTLTDASGSEMDIEKTDRGVSLFTDDQSFRVASNEDVELIKDTLTTLLRFNFKEWCA